MNVKNNPKIIATSSLNYKQEALDAGANVFHRRDAANGIEIFQKDVCGDGSAYCNTCNGIAMVIERNDGLREMYRKILGKYCTRKDTPCIAHCYDTVEKALKEYSEIQPGIVVVGIDFGPYGMTGLEFIEKIRKGE